MAIKLFNKGKREIHGGTVENGWKFLPQTAMEFDEETGTKLKALYPDELLSLNDVQKQFEPTKPKAKGKSAEKESLIPPAPKDETEESDEIEEQENAEEKEIMDKLKAGEEAAKAAIKEKKTK